MSLNYNDKAQALLEGLGFKCEPEPDWVVEGRKPDFFCTGPLDIWVEVKSLPRPGENVQVTRILKYLFTYQNRVHGGGRALAFVAPSAKEQHAKTSLKLADYALCRFDLSDIKELVVVVPNDPDLSERLHLAYTTEKGKTLLVTYKSSSDQYGYPYSTRPNPYHQKVTLSAGPGNTHGWFDQIAKADKYLVALQISDFDKKPFKISGGTSSGGGGFLDTSGPVRDAIRDGNPQIKNGLKYREAPAALFLYQEGALVPDDMGILASLFGDLQYVFWPEQFKDGRFQFGPNGALRGKHSSISAIVYFRNEGIPLTVHNPWAARPLPHGLFGGREYLPLIDGTLQLIERSSAGQGPGHSP